ncbi:Membrane lipoprotein lipid attachment site [Roseibacterium elongatum DSM 19469]|uniref:Membrane lipoprotein lipid attachment site n=1 Tax=Roseicyclus elongatus DSM 19469 TaxID=1294273 RepID=W8RY56_9RHOB|nr:ABC-type transport auxiliary lipoprotein family protein [Roseibacterium elongatum]AHM02782.1 Membrane lipoprotein lipid attachment site [Roseibacterium elongatum DSM 19469]
MQLVQTIRVLLLGLAVTALASCGALSALGDATEALDVYELRAPTDAPIAPGRRIAADVIIEVPTTSGALQTDRIMIRPDALAASYLPGIRWSEEAPVMVQTLMLRTLDATQAIRYVGRRPLGAGGDFAVVTELVDFQATPLPEGDSARVDVRMIVRIVRERNVRIVASRSFATSAMAPTLEDADLVAAFDTAAGRVMSDFADWALVSLRRS